MVPIMEFRLQQVKSMTNLKSVQVDTFIMNSSSNISVLCGENCNIQSYRLVSTNSFELNATNSLSDDSGVPLTSSSISSGDSYRLGVCKFELELVESDGEVSQFDSLDNCSDVGMSAENFNTLKKGPFVPIDPPPEFQDSPQRTLGHSKVMQDYAVKFSKSVISTAINRWSSQNTMTLKGISTELINFIAIGKRNTYCSQSLEDIYRKQNFASDPVLNKCSGNIYDKPSYDFGEMNKNSTRALNEEQKDEQSTCTNNKTLAKDVTIHELNTTKLTKPDDYGLYFGRKRNCIDNFQQRKSSVFCSPLQHHNGNNFAIGNRPNSRNSLNSRLSSSHNSLSIPNANKADDSIFITQAMSHDALLSREISDFYNVPLDSDIYALPIDMIKPNNKDMYQRNNEKQKCRLKYPRNNKKKKRIDGTDVTTDKYGGKLKVTRSNSKRHSVPENSIEPLHMTLDEVKRFYHSLYSNANDCNAIFSGKGINATSHMKHLTNNDIIKENNTNSSLINQVISNATDISSSKCLSNTKNKKLVLRHEAQSAHNSNKFPSYNEKKISIHHNLKQKFCSIFRFRKNRHNSNEFQLEDNDYMSSRTNQTNVLVMPDKRKFSTRALPPLPSKGNGQKSIVGSNDDKSEFSSTTHLASSIEKVKDYGWYWGPISSEAAERILSNEPDGSFIVRDSSDDHYIFSLSFKLNNCVRHVRIEQDQGTFSFGSYAKFKSQTITEFIEKAVEHSRSGRYLFFLHRRPEHGPMRVQLTNPVSRFKHIQSLQHLCRFVILKAVVRKDLIQTLPLPRRLLDYLSYKHCYSEQIESDASQSQTSGDCGS